VLATAMGPVACREIEGLNGLVFDLGPDGGTLDGGGGGGPPDGGSGVPCGTICNAGASCQNGACVCITSCPSGCADLSSDLANCGSCGHVCNPGQACKGGHCH
jgi:hypothetical protein